MGDEAIKKALDIFSECVRCLKDNGRNRCLLIAKSKENFIYSVSGICDGIDDAGKLYKIRKDINGKLNELIGKVFPKITFRKTKRIVEYASMDDNVLFKDEFVKEGIGRQYNFEKFGNIKNGIYNHRHYSCVERKLLAKFENSLTEIGDCDYIVCRYLPCKYCYWVVQSLSNFYVFGNGEMFRIMIPQNFNFNVVALSVDQRLLIEILDNCHNDNKDVGIGPNYIYVKESVK